MISKHISFDQLADRTPGQGFRRDMADTGARRYAAETGIGDHRDVLAEIEIVQRRVS